MRLAGCKYPSVLFVYLLLLKYTLTASPDCAIHTAVTELTVDPEVSLKSFS